MRVWPSIKLGHYPAIAQVLHEKPRVVKLEFALAQGQGTSKSGGGAVWCCCGEPACAGLPNGGLNRLREDLSRVSFRVVMGQRPTGRNESRAVTPAKAGVQVQEELDSRFRGNGVTFDGAGRGISP